MCGIFGFSKSTPLTMAMTAPLALMMNTRGNDSWGVTDGDYIYKDNMSILDSFVEMGLEAPAYHTRGASVGAVTERNAHPFRVETDAKVVIGLHNGHVANHAELARKYNRKQIEVDSEHIFYHLAEDRSLRDIGGWGNVVWWEFPTGKPEQRKRYFARFGGTTNLHFAKMVSGEIVFASTEDAVRVAAQLCGGTVKFFYKTRANMKYSISPKHGLLVHEDMEWGKDWVEPKVVTHYKGGGGHGGFTGNRYAFGTNSDIADLCAMTGCIRRIGPNDLVCEDCLDKLRVEMVAV